MQLKRIDNMDILTTDVGKLVDFYHGVLGLPFFLPYVQGEEWTALDCGNLTLYIFKTNSAVPSPERRTAVNLEDPPGLDSFAFEVDDLDSALAELEGNVDWAFDEVITWEHPNGIWYRYRPFFDPDGTMLYVTEPHKSGEHA